MDSFLCLARSQLRRSDQSQPITEEIGNRNENSSPTNDPVPRNQTAADYAAEVAQDFRVAEDTTTWSSLAITRENVQIDSSNIETGNLNNNLTVPRIRRNSSVESLADYEGNFFYAKSISFNSANRYSPALEILIELTRRFPEFYVSYIYRSLVSAWYLVMCMLVYAIGHEIREFVEKFVEISIISFNHFVDGPVI